LVLYHSFVCLHQAGRIQASDPALAGALKVKKKVKFSFVLLVFCKNSFTKLSLTIPRQLEDFNTLYFINQKSYYMKSYLPLLVSAFLLTLVSCTKDADQSAGISDATLSSMTTSEDLVLARTTHTDAGDWVIKMNQLAAKACADGIKNFPPNAMIVKEQRDANGKVMRRSVMYNAPADANSSDNWLWSEFDASGHVIFSNAEKGMSCQSCHAALSKAHL
jgi:hypothetical protein